MVVPITTLNAEKTKATVADVSLERGEVVEYIDNETHGSGVIEEFWFIDPEDMKSAWMKIRDLNGGEAAVISLRNWYNDLKEGYIKN